MLSKKKKIFTAGLMFLGFFANFQAVYAFSYPWVGTPSATCEFIGHSVSPVGTKYGNEDLYDSTYLYHVTFPPSLLQKMITLDDVSHEYTGVSILYTTGAPDSYSAPLSEFFPSQSGNVYTFNINQRYRKSAPLLVPSVVGLYLNYNPKADKPVSNTEILSSIVVPCTGTGVDNGIPPTDPAPTCSPAKDEYYPGESVYFTVKPDNSMVVQWDDKPDYHTSKSFDIPKSYTSITFDKNVTIRDSAGKNQVVACSAKIKKIDDFKCGFYKNDVISTDYRFFIKPGSADKYTYKITSPSGTDLSQYYYDWYDGSVLNQKKGNRDISYDITAPFDNHTISVFKHKNQDAYHSPTLLDRKIECPDVTILPETYTCSVNGGNNNLTLNSSADVVYKIEGVSGKLNFSNKDVSGQLPATWILGKNSVSFPKDDNAVIKDTTLTLTSAFKNTIVNTDTPVSLRASVRLPGNTFTSQPISCPEVTLVSQTESVSCIPNGVDSSGKSLFFIKRQGLKSANSNTSSFKKVCFDSSKIGSCITSLPGDMFAVDLKKIPDTGFAIHTTAADNTKGDGKCEVSNPKVQGCRLRIVGFDKEYSIEGDKTQPPKVPSFQLKAGGTIKYSTDYIIDFSGKYYWGQDFMSSGNRKVTSTITDVGTLTQNTPIFFKDKDSDSDKVVLTAVTLKPDQAEKVYCPSFQLQTETDPFTARIAEVDTDNKPLTNQSASRIYHEGDKIPLYIEVGGRGDKDKNGYYNNPKLGVVEAGKVQAFKGMPVTESQYYYEYETSISYSDANGKVLSKALPSGITNNIDSISKKSITVAQIQIPGNILLKEANSGDATLTFKFKGKQGILSNSDGIKEFSLKINLLKNVSSLPTGGFSCGLFSSKTGDIIVDGTALNLVTYGLDPQFKVTNSDPELQSKLGSYTYTWKIKHIKKTNNGNSEIDGQGSFSNEKVYEQKYNFNAHDFYETFKASVDVNVEGKKYSNIQCPSFANKPPAFDAEFGYIESPFELKQEIKLDKYKFLFVNKVKTSGDDIKRLVLHVHGSPLVDSQHSEPYFLIGYRRSDTGDNSDFTFDKIPTRNQSTGSFSKEDDGHVFVLPTTFKDVANFELPLLDTNVGETVDSLNVNFNHYFGNGTPGNDLFGQKGKDTKGRYIGYNIEILVKSNDNNSQPQKIIIPVKIYERGTQLGASIINAVSKENETKHLPASIFQALFDFFSFKR